MLPEEQLKQVKTLREEVVELRRRLLIARDEVQRLRESPVLQQRPETPRSHSAASRRLADAVNRLSSDERGAMQRLLEKAQVAAGTRIRNAADIQRRTSRPAWLRPARSGHASASSSHVETAQLEERDTQTSQANGRKNRHRSARTSERKLRNADAHSSAIFPANSSVHSANSSTPFHPSSNQSPESRRSELEAYLSSKCHLMAKLIQKPENNRAASAPDAADGSCRVRQSKGGSTTERNHGKHEPPEHPGAVDKRHAEGERAEKRYVSPYDAEVQELLKKAYSDGLVSLDMVELARLHAVVRNVARQLYSRGQGSPCRDAASMMLAEELAREEAAGLIPAPQGALEAHPSAPPTLTPSAGYPPQHSMRRPPSVQARSRRSRTRRHHFSGEELVLVHRPRPVPISRSADPCAFYRERSLAFVEPRVAVRDEEMGTGDHARRRRAREPFQRRLQQRSRIAAFLVQQRCMIQRQQQPTRTFCTGRWLTSVAFLLAVAWVLVFVVKGNLGF